MKISIAKICEPKTSHSKVEIVNHYITHLNLQKYKIPTIFNTIITISFRRLVSSWASTWECVLFVLKIEIHLILMLSFIGSVEFDSF